MGNANLIMIISAFPCVIFAVLLIFTPPQTPMYFPDYTTPISIPQLRR